MLLIRGSGERGKAYVRRSRSTHMSMSEFEGQLNNDGDAISSLHKQEHNLPADFGGEYLAFVEELNVPFSPEEEELPPYFAHSLLESEHPRFFPFILRFARNSIVRFF